MIIYWTNLRNKNEIIVFRPTWSFLNRFEINENVKYVNPMSFSVSTTITLDYIHCSHCKPSWRHQRRLVLLRRQEQTTARTIKLTAIYIYINECTLTKISLLIFNRRHGQP